MILIILLQKIKDLDINYILLSTRKVYKIGDNLENSPKMTAKHLF